jgi:hypothetical protein
MDRADQIPANILNDPRHLIPECVGCRHSLEEGLCGLDYSPAEVWSLPAGCPEYDPLLLTGGGDPNPEAPMEY